MRGALAGALCMIAGSSPAADRFERYDTTNWSLVVMYDVGTNAALWAIAQTPPPQQPQRPSIMLDCMLTPTNKIMFSVKLRANQGSPPSTNVPVAVEFDGGTPIGFSADVIPGGDAIANFVPSIFEQVRVALLPARRARVTVAPDMSSFEVSGFREIGIRLREICDQMTNSAK